ncbi:family 20 glycosylhydrolase [Thermomonas brevis]|uniref:beta-N-acetylhexosaminidase n=1 Tax=Thermomonas brevis TaxID=215691 RepID=A0A7G9QPQ4_9GAMM|nr:family 20 glycosylhydrolase [Thermomonas brevis]QNN45329.1 family 20 glycosylhydrolase [Thermomonas brevis]
MKPRTAFLPAALCLALLAAPGARADDAVVVPKLVPLPAHMVRKPGGFTVTADTPVRAADGPALRHVGAQFKAMLGERLPLMLDLAKDGSRGNNIEFALDATRKWSAPDAYSIDIDERGVRVYAGDAKGLYYGAVTLAQLLTSGDAGGASVRLPALHIDDAPRFGWRGFMLDSARHFQSVDEIKRLLDAMAQLKLDVFHWHLTDDQGWRFPVPGWPKLTTVGSCRLPAGDGGIDAATGKPAPYCGFYTEAQIREVVAYAAERHIDVVPEVDIPGHATAAIAAYPQLGVSGEPVAVSNEWGVNVNLFNADETTMRFLEDVLTQVAKLFPGKFVHIGGDEAVKDQWKASPKMQARIRELGVDGEEGLQAWMVARLERALAAHGKRLLGWDEILMGELPPSATVMSWRGIEGGIDAAKKGHDVVMAPSDVLYLDYLQTHSPDEPPGRPATIELHQVYGFEPVPKALDAQQAKHILGVQANVWTEHMRNFARVQHAYFPRIAALAEVAWSPKAERDYAGFLQRLPAMLPRWKAQGLAVATTPFQPQIDAGTPLADGSAEVAVQQPLGYALRYTTDGSAPTAASPLYFASLALPLPATLTVQTFFDDRPLGAPATRTFSAASLLTRSDEELAMCTDQLMLRLEDDGPRLGDRAIFNVDIFNPCWTWKRAPLAGIGAIEVRAGRIPYFFQLAHDEPHRTFKPAKTAHGELELHAGCDGPLLATLPMPEKPNADGFVTLRAPLHDAPADADLCLWFTGDTRPAMWVLDRVTLQPK